tara:strand:- start:663 stop:1460 length:798 start_codon:yes stop_codon:yes gene_type:complete
MSGPLPSSGPLSLLNIQEEFLGSNPIGLSEYYRGGALVPNSSSTTTIPTSGTIAVSNFYGTRRRIAIPITISSPTFNYDLFTNRSPSYVAGISDMTFTVNGGVRVGSTSVDAYAMSVPSSFNAGDTINVVNNGYIQGMGGTGGPSILGASPGPAGFKGGNAMYANRPVTVQNNGVLASGGGGGGAGGGGQDDKGPARRGAGGGGGSGDAAPGGAGGGRGAAGNNGVNSGGANPRSGGAGGATGYYITGNSYVTWSATGTRQGSVA